MDDRLVESYDCTFRELNATEDEASVCVILLDRQSPGNDLCWMRILRGWRQGLGLPASRWATDAYTAVNGANPWGVWGDTHQCATKHLRRAADENIPGMALAASSTWPPVAKRRQVNSHLPLA